MNSENKSFFSIERISVGIVLFTICLAFVYNTYIWISQPDVISKRKSSIPVLVKVNSPQQYPEEFAFNERRIAQHFATDTLPGLMQHGLIKRYIRHENGTLLLVAGKIWKERSRFFKESLIKEISIYNKVNGYVLDTCIIDHRSRDLYARVNSANQKEFFD